jgi:serine/threonine-protein kinase
VADFGIARAISDSSDTNLTKTGSVMGTATYFSPEQARGAAIDPRSDVYSLGCVIYEMIIGQPPFTGENAVAIAYKHVQEPPPSPRSLDPAIPDTLEAIIMKCLAKNVDNRYPSAQDLRADLRRYLDGARIMAEPVMAGVADPGATGLMAPTGYMQPTAAVSPYNDAYGDPYDDGYGDEDEEEEKKSKAPLIVLILLLLLLAGLLLWWALSGSGGGDSEVDVPSDLIGMNIEDASAALEDVGLEADRDRVTEPDDLQSRFSVSPDDTETGEVVAQDPGAGEVLSEGDKVTLSYWAGEIELITIPDLAGTDRYDAQDELRELGFTNFKEEFEASEEYEQDQVTRTDPGANTEAEPDSEITLWISEGEEQVTVPDVVGLNQTDAEAAINGVEGLSVGNITDDFDDTVPDGSVISQSATGEVNAGTAVDLVVSKGAEVTDVTVPSVVGEPEDNAMTILSNEGLQGSVTETIPTSDPAQDSQVRSQNPQANQTVPEGSTISLVVYEYTEPDDPPDTTQPPNPPLPLPGDDD